MTLTGKSSVSAEPKARSFSLRRRRFVAAAAALVVLITVLIWWIKVKDDLFTDDSRAGGYPSTTSSTGPIADTGSPSKASHAPSTAAGDVANARLLDFLKTAGKPVWDRQDRTEWLASTTDARLVAQDQSAGFMEYAAGNNWAKKHAVFILDHMVLHELMVLRGSQQDAVAWIDKFTATLGPPELDEPPDNLSQKEREGTVSFRQWRVKEGGRQFVVRCMVRTGETKDGILVHYFQQTFVDTAAMTNTASFFQADAEPSYEGKTLTTLLELLDDADTRQRQEAVIVLNKITLKRDGDIKRTTARLVTALSDRDALVGSFAASALVRLGDQGVTELFNALMADTDGSIPPTAIAQLASAGTKAIDPLVILLRQRNQKIAVLACSALAGIGKPAVTALITATESSGERSDQVHALALTALGEIGPDAQAALPAIKAMLEDRNPGVRDAARDALRMVRGTR